MVAPGMSFRWQRNPQGHLILSAAFMMNGESRGYTREAATRPNNTRSSDLKCSHFPRARPNVPDALLFRFQPAFHISAISGRIEPSKPTFGSDFAKELPVQESKTEIQPNAMPSCWVLSQLPLCYPLIVSEKQISQNGTGIVRNSCVSSAPTYT
jgi:hypothetical protein